MPAKYHIEDEANIIIIKWEGNITTSELIEVIKEYQKNIQRNPDYINYNEIFDASTVTKIRITINGLLKVGRTASKTDHLFTNKKLAIIVSSNWAFRIARLYETYRNMGVESCKKIRVFKDENEAITWAKSNA